jgi:hypothetical protein
MTWAQVEALIPGGESGIWSDKSKIAYALNPDGEFPATFVFDAHTQVLMGLMVRRAFDEQSQLEAALRDAEGELNLTHGLPEVRGMRRWWTGGDFADGTRRTDIVLTSTEDGRLVLAYRPFESPIPHH